MRISAKQLARFVAIRSSEPLGSSMLTFDLNAEIERLPEEDVWQTARNSKMLVKHADVRMVLTVLKSKARLHEHKAAGRISVQTVASHIRMHVESEVLWSSCGTFAGT